MQLKHPARACPSCGPAAATVLHAMKFTLPAGSPLPPAYDLVACESCGFCYADTPGSQADYDRYYADFSKYESPTLASGSGAEPEDALRLAQTARTLAGLAPDSARVLDVGAANGGLLAALRDAGFRHLSGIDPSPRCVQTMREAGFEAHRGVLGSAPAAPERRYDLVLLSHVLEHVLDLPSGLRSIETWLADDGLVYVEVPDAGAYAEHPRAPFYYFDSEHINHFDAAHLADFLLRGGYAPVAQGRKHLMLADGAPYPAVWVTARRQNQAACAAAPAVDFSLREHLLAYIAQSEAASSNALIDEYAATGQPVVIWGAGQNTMRLMQSSRLADCNIVAIVDGDTRKQGQEFAGHTVRAPQSLAALKHQPPPVVLISAAIHSRRIADELRQIRPEQPFALV